MIRRIDSGTLYHEVMKVASEPSITTKGGTFVVSNQRQITYREKLPKGKLVLVVSQATRRAKGPVTKTLSTSSDVTTEFYFSLLQKNPVEIMSTPQLRYLWVDNAFYEAESNLTFDQAVALVRESGLKRARKIQRAVEAAQASQLGTRVQREAISDAVKHHIWVRDEGRCVECESPTELQFDHVIPLAMGGSNELANLQLLCAVCNRRKGANLTVNPLPGHLVGSAIRISNGPPTTSAPLTAPSYIPGPKYLLVPGSLPDTDILDNVVRVHQLGRTEALRMIAEARIFVERFMADLSQIGAMTDDVKYVLTEFMNRRASDADVSENQSELIRSTPKAVMMSDKQLLRLKNRLDQSLAGVMTFLRPASETFAALVPRVADLAEKMNVAPDPKSSTGEQRAMFWAGYLNELQSLRRDQESSLNYEKYLKSKRQLDEDAQLVKSIFTSGVTSESPERSQLETKTKWGAKSSLTQLSQTSPGDTLDATTPSEFKMSQIFEVSCINCKQTIFWNSVTEVAIHKGTGLSGCVGYAEKLGMPPISFAPDRGSAKRTVPQNTSPLLQEFGVRIEATQNLLEELLKRSTGEAGALTELTRLAARERDEVTRIFASLTSAWEGETIQKPSLSDDVSSLSGLIFDLERSLTSLEQRINTSKIEVEEFLVNCNSKYERPELSWEYKLLVSEIQSRIDVLRPGTELFLAGNREESGEEIHDAQAFFTESPKRMAEILRSVDAMDVPKKLNEALGPPGEAGNEVLIRSFARDLIEIPHQMLNLGRAVRGARLGSEFLEAQNMMSRLVQEPLRSFISNCDTFCDNLLAGLAAREAGGTQLVSLRLVLNFDVSKTDTEAIKAAVVRALDVSRNSRTDVLL
jgi:hypothetical protein